MKLFGSRKCDHESVSPFKARCTREPGHTGRHGARGLRWGADGKILFTGSARGSRR